MYRNYDDPTEDPVYSEVINCYYGDNAICLFLLLYMTTQSIELDLSTVVPSLSGPKRPYDCVSLSEIKEDFQKCLDNKVSSCHSNFVYISKIFGSK